MGAGAGVDSGVSADEYRFGGRRVHIEKMVDLSSSNSLTLLRLPLPPPRRPPSLLSLMMAVWCLELIPGRQQVSFFPQ